MKYNNKVLLIVSIIAMTFSIIVIGSAQEREMEAYTPISFVKKQTIREVKLPKEKKDIIIKQDNITSALKNNIRKSNSGSNSSIVTIERQAGEETSNLNEEISEVLTVESKKDNVESNQNEYVYNIRLITPSGVENKTLSSQYSFLSSKDIISEFGLDDTYILNGETFTCEEQIVVEQPIIVGWTCLENNNTIIVFQQFSNGTIQEKEIPYSQEIVEELPFICTEC